MPIGYLLTVIIIMAATLVALAPPRRPRPLASLAWRVAIVPNELPFPVSFGLLASTLLALAQGDLHSPGGRVAAGLAVLTAVGLGAVVWRGCRAGPALERALQAGLGADWRAAIDSELAGRLRRRPPLTRILLRPFLVRRGDVERVANLRYGDAGRHHLLDVYRHRSRPKAGPTLVYLHGGGFFRGRKDREALPLIYRLASQGWVCVGANYRLRPAAEFPDQLVDVKRVIAWVRAAGHAYGADPAVVLVAGSSAGGHLASLAALTAHDPAFQPGFESVDTSVAGAIALYGYYGPIGSAQGVPSSPLAYVHTGAPPFFLAHGDRDTLLPAEGARVFAERLRGASANPVVYAELPGGQHSFDLFHSPRFEAVVAAVEAFAAWVRSRPASP